MELLGHLVQEVGDGVRQGLCLVVVVHRRQVLPDLVAPNLDQPGPCTPHADQIDGANAREGSEETHGMGEMGCAQTQETAGRPG